MTNQLEALKVSYYALKGENAELKAEVERRRRANLLGSRNPDCENPVLLVSNR